MYKNFNIYSQKFNIFNNFSKINIIFGANSSGKTTIVNNLIEIFSGKDKTAKINDMSISKDNYNIINIDSEFQINELTKLTSKNINKIKIQNIINDQNNFYLKEELSKFLNSFQRKLDETINKDSILKWEIKDQNIDDLALNLIEGNINASKSEENILYIKEKISIENTKNIIFIDDFDIYLNEEKTLAILKLLESLDAVIFLTTNKPESLFYSYNKYSNFVCKNVVLKSLMSILEISDENNDISSYLLNNLYYETLIHSLNLDKIIYSIGRLIVNNNTNVVFKNECLQDKVNIHSTNEAEYKLLMKIKSNLDNY